MFGKQYKKDFDSITPNPELINNLIEQIEEVKPEKNKKYRKPLVATAAIVVLAVSIFAGSNIIHQNNPSFTLVAYAEDNTGGVNITEDAQVNLPFGKISRTGKSSYEDENGKIIYGYDVGFEEGIISVVGNNINSVTYTAEKGELLYSDSVMFEKMQEEGKLEVCSFMVPEEVANSNDKYTTFEKLWNEGHFEDVKNQYFRGKSTNIADYIIGFEQTEEQIEKNIWIVTIYYEFENGPPYIKQGQEVTAKYYAELGDKSFEINWIPDHAIDLALEYKPLDFADLPEDNIKITVHFANGKTAVKHLNLSFDSEGNLIAKVVNKD